MGLDAQAPTVIWLSLYYSYHAHIFLYALVQLTENSTARSQRVKRVSGEDTAWWREDTRETMRIIWCKWMKSLTYRVGRRQEGRPHFWKVRLAICDAYPPSGRKPGYCIFLLTSKQKPAG